MVFDHDIVIVGSGPAGSAVALHLQQIAPHLLQRTLILDQASHPRHKLCAGGLVLDVDVCLNKMGLSVEDVPHVRVPWAHVLYEGRGFKLRLNREIAFRVCHRNVFDHWLISQAQQRGVALQSQTKVTGLQRIDGGFEIQTSQGTMTARVVVGADGSKSMVRRTLATDPLGGPSNIARVVEIVTPAAPFPAAHPPREADDAVFEMRWLSQDVQGYAWDFPTLREGQSLRTHGVYDSRVLQRHSAGSLAKFLDADLQEQELHLTDYDLKGAPLRWFSAQGPFAGPHVLLAGDAAGVDAIFGEGISIALGYGELAAKALHDAFASDDFSFASYPRSVLRSRLGRSLRRRTLTAKLLFGVRNPRLQHLIWWNLGSVASWYIKRYVFNWAR